MNDEKLAAAVRERGLLRTGFTKLAKAIQAALDKEDFSNEIQAKWDVLAVKYEKIVKLDDIVLSHRQNEEEAELLAEMEQADSYQMTFFTIRNAISLRKSDSAAPKAPKEVDMEDRGRRFRLPKLELKKFNGDISNWIGFWAQFSGIDADPTLSNEEKFQYLLQATVPETRARAVIDSFPPAGDNYQKAVDALKERFGEKDLLTEYYVRELLKLLSTRGEMELHVLYDKLGAQLSALDTLGVVSDTYATMLFPLVESCLPSDVLRLWQRTNQVSKSRQEQLNDLLAFIKREVETEERVLMAASQPTYTSQEQGRSPANFAERCPTATGLANLSIHERCVFCENNHDSTECRKAVKMPLEEKKRRLTRTGRCFSCAGLNHQSRKCRRTCINCGGRHSEVMCDVNIPGTSQKVGRKETDLLAINHNLTVGGSSEVYLQTFVVKLFNQHDERNVRVLIDSGSQRSYILTQLAKELKYEQIGAEKLNHSLFGGCSGGLSDHTLFKARLKSERTNYTCNFTVLDQRTIASFIPTAIPDASVKEELRRHKIELLSDSAGQIEVLIGADVAGKLWTGQRLVLSSGMVVVETEFGWTLMGTPKHQVPATTCSSNLATTYTMSIVATGDVSELWRLDALGIGDPAEKRGREAQRIDALNHFGRTVKFENGRYQVRLPFYQVVADLPTNRALAQARLNGIMKKMRLNKELFQKYDAVFCEWMDLDIIEAVEHTDKGHYLPHRPVVKESSSTTKVRPVFDASAKTGKFPSLNECLEQGPNLIELIPDILLRFREKKVGISADIEKAFLQIWIHPDDREYLKFLWWNSQGEQITLRHSRVVFGVNCSPFLLAAVMDHHIRKSVEEASAEDLGMLLQLKAGFYVDNLASSVNDRADAAKMEALATTVMKKGGFNLRGWELSYDGKSCIPTPILGLKWDRENDTIGLNMDWWEKATDGDEVTKRIILSMCHKIFDPIGFTAPATLNLKLMLRTLWQKNYGWDDPLSDEDQQDFRVWLEQVSLLKRIAVRRNLGTGKNTSLHLFTDASKNAYAACVFLRSEDEDGRARVSLVLAKSRVTPLKELTMARCELIGVVIGARLLKSVQDALGWSSVPVYAWCDSSTVLAWVQRKEEWSVFVRNRVKEVRELTSQVVWRHIAGPRNPADLPSRGCTIEHLVQSQWWTGPEWLLKEEPEWPQSHCTYQEVDIAAEKCKQAAALVNSTNKEVGWFYRYFESFEGIVRMVGWMHRFRFNSQNSQQRRAGPLTVPELSQAEETVLRLVQAESFSSLTDVQIRELSPFMDEKGLIRVNTRITAREDDVSFTRPILLPSKHVVVKRLTRFHHLKTNHAGAHTLWSVLREKFWILKGHQVTRNVVRECVVCRRHAGKSFDVASPPLPQARVSNATVFEVTGVDYAGPLTLRNGDKTWIALFTCAVYRAVHLEMVTSLSTQAFLLAFRRFIARRGRLQDHIQ